MKNNIINIGVVILSILFFVLCSKDSSNNPPLNYSIIKGRIMNFSDSSGIDSANVVLYDANTNNPVMRLFSDVNGYYCFNVPSGTYFLKVFAQGFFPYPRLDDAPLPFTSVINDTVIRNVFLFSDSSKTSTGKILGTVNFGTSAISGALVVALRTTDLFAISTASGPDGIFVFYNIPSGTYHINCYIANYQQITDTILTVLPNNTITGINIQITKDSISQLRGKITFLASKNSQVDITLVHPKTKDAIPGLSTINDINNDYLLFGIPPGTYIAWASYRNDGYVMDPDWIRKSGLPIVTFEQNDTLKIVNFSVTDAIPIISPTNVADSIFPIPINTSTPTFVWEPYPSAKEYIIQVFDNHGMLIWGGFDANGVIKHAQINQQQTSVVFNFDGSAVDTLKNGEIYRWKVFADNDATPNIQGLISSSEDLRGLFKVSLP